MAMQDPRNQSPFNALPAAVVAIVVVIAGVEVMFQLAEAGLLAGAGLGDGWRQLVMRDWSLNGLALNWMLERQVFPPELLVQFATYPLIHQGFTHTLMVCVFTLALGNVTAPYLPGWRIFVLFFAPTLVGGLVFAALFDTYLIGGFVGAYGLIGAFAYLSRLGLTRVPPESAFLLLGFLMAITPIFGLATGNWTGWIPDWVAEGVGAAVGYGLAILLFPGGLQRLRDRMRQR